MNPLWHILISHGPKLAIIGFGLWVRYANARRANEAKLRGIRPPQSSPGPDPIQPKSMTSTPKTAKTPPNFEQKIDASPWSQNNDPFNQ